MGLNPFEFKFFCIKITWFQLWLWVKNCQKN